MPEERDPVADEGSNRRCRRWNVQIPIFVEADDQTHYCTVYDISPGGALVRPLQIGAMPIGATVVVDLEHFGHLRAEVRHHTKGVVGLQFLHDATAAQALSRWLMTTRPERRQIRYPCNLEAKIVTNNRELDCVIFDLSRSGAGVRSAQADRLVVASEVLLKWPDYGTMAASVSHIEDDMIGLALLDGYDGRLPPGDAETTES